MKNFFYLFSGLIFFKAAAASAVCPICTVAVTAALGLSQWLGIDDVVSGIWIGGLAVSLIIWTLNWLKGKNWRFRYDAWVWTIIYFGLVYFSLVWGGFLFLPGNQLWGLDRLLLGMAMGSVIFLAAVLVYEYSKKKNSGRAHFPYEKVVIPVGALIGLSFIFYFVTR